VTVGQIILPEKNLEDWRKKQREDPVLMKILNGMEIGVHPSRSDYGTRDASFRIYISYWDALILKDGVLYKRWFAPNLKSSFLQLIVPRKLVKEVLEEALLLEDILAIKPWRGFESVFTGQHASKMWKIGASLAKCVCQKKTLWEKENLLSKFIMWKFLLRECKWISLVLFLSTSGNRYLLVIVDCFSKWAFPLKNIRTKTVAEVFVSRVFVVSRHGVPLEIHTDQGRNFESKLFVELIEILEIRKTRTTALDPQSDGQEERQYRTLINYLDLSKYISTDQRDWDRWVHMFLLFYRTSKHFFRFLQ